MADSSSLVPILNQCLRVEVRSLFQYLRYAQPWSEDVNAEATLDLICERQQRIGERLVDRIVELDGVPDQGSFPSDWSHFHFIDFEYFLPTLIAQARQDIERCQAHLEQVAEDPASTAILQEALEQKQWALEALEHAQSKVTPTAG